MPNLIPDTKISQSFGFDTTQMAIGRLPGDSDGDGGELRLTAGEFNTLMRLMIKAVAASAEKPLSVVLTVNTFKIAHDVTVSCKRDDADDDDDLDATREFDILVRCKATGYGTRMIVRLQRDTNNAFWLNERANPTSLINGYNALGVALDGLSPRKERAAVLRVPFDMLKAILQKVDREFDWTKATRRRIRKLEFKACPVQVFTYVPTAPFEPSQFLGFLRAFLSCPIGDGRGHYALVPDLLGIEVESKLVGGPVQSLLLKFRQSGRIAWSVNLYDKDAAAAVDAAVIKSEVGSRATREFLRDRVRVDVTLHDGALRDLMAEAKLGRKRGVSLTAANLNRAINRLNRKRGKGGHTFVRWMLHQIFGVQLPLTKLLGYRPSLIDEVRAAVARHSDAAAAVVDQWRDHQFMFSKDGKTLGFVAFATHPKLGRLTRQTARTLRRLAAKAGLDLDLPLPVYDALFILRHYFDLDDNDRRALAVALEAGDGVTALNLMKRSKDNSAATGKRLAKMFAAVIKEARVPAVDWHASAKDVGLIAK